MVILVTKTSESLLKNIAGWRPYSGWLGHRKAYCSCRLWGLKSEVQSLFIWAMACR